MKYKAVIADVDGTIIPPSEKPAPSPSEKLKNAVEAIKKKGAIFSIASGRSLEWVEEIIKGLQLESPIILDNGARIYDIEKKKYIWESIMAKEDAKKALFILKKDKTLRIFVTNVNERLKNPKKITDWRIIKILVLGVSQKKAESLHRKLRIIPTLHVTKSVSGLGDLNQSIHVTSHTATKQVAIVKLAEFLGISTKEMIGIGDSYNDFPLLLACGLKVAMRNAVPEIKEIADYIAPSYREEGVVEVLEKFILGKVRPKVVKAVGPFKNL